MLFTLLAGVCAMHVALADGDDHAANNDCPAAYQSQIDNAFGVGTSIDTTCITKRENIKVAMNLSANLVNPKSGIGQTLTEIARRVFPHGSSCRHNPIRSAA